MEEFQQKAIKAIVSWLHEDDVQPLLASNSFDKLFDKYDTYDYYSEDLNFGNNIAVLSFVLQQSHIEFLSHMAILPCGIFDGVMFNYKFFNSIFIPDNIQKIDSSYSSFYNDTFLTDVNLPVIKEQFNYRSFCAVFKNCKNLKNVTYRGTTAQLIDVLFDHGKLSSSNFATALKNAGIKKLNIIHCTDGDWKIPQPEPDQVMYDVHQEVAQGGGFRVLCAGRPTAEVKSINWVLNGFVTSKYALSGRNYPLLFKSEADANAFIKALYDNGFEDEGLEISIHKKTYTPNFKFATIRTDTGPTALISSTLRNWVY